MNHFGIDAQSEWQGFEGLGMPREADIFPPATRSPDQILRIVLRAVCGFERVEEVCQREGISLEQFHKWRQLFADACQEWTHANGHVLAGLAEQSDETDGDAADLPRPVLTTRGEA